MVRSPGRPAYGALIALLAVVAAPQIAGGGVRLVHVWTHDAGGEARAEIVAYDAEAGELLVTDGDRQRVTRLDLRRGCVVGRYDVSAFGAPTSVAASHGLVAVAVPAAEKTDPGHVLLFRSTRIGGSSGAPLAVVSVGALPDMITFTPDGRTILVANEGEPSNDYQVDPTGSISIIDVRRGPERAVARVADFAAFDGVREELEQFGVRLAAPSAHNSDGRATVAEDLEPEYITVAPDGRTAWVTLQENNAVAVVDVPRAHVSQIIGLGLKDHHYPGNGLSVGGGEPRLWPVWGMYQPDSIASFAVDGATYLVTANEGDHRAYAGFTDIAPLSELTLDEALLRGTPGLAGDGGLGRLMVSSVAGDTDGDGDVDRLLAFGARSISIWSTDGRLVYDSGDALERAIAQRLPQWPDDAALRDQIGNRSFQKGPEPEGVVVGLVGSRTYAFVGLERTSAIAVFDVTRPHESTLVDVVPLGPRNVAPEGLAFIPAERSPLGEPLLAVACEVSGTTVLYRIRATR